MMSTCNNLESAFNTGRPDTDSIHRHSPGSFCNNRRPQAATSHGTHSERTRGLRPDSPFNTRCPLATTSHGTHPGRTRPRPWKSLRHQMSNSRHVTWNTSWANAATARTVPSTPDVHQLPGDDRHILNEPGHPFAKRQGCGVHADQTIVHVDRHVVDIHGI